MKKKILFVDGDPNVFGHWGKKLEEEGYEVIKSLTGKRAMVILFENKEIDLVILEIELPDIPDIDGISILRKIKEMNPKLPVIMHATRDFKNDFASWVSEAYIIKNWDDPSASELLGTVKNFVH